MALKVALIAERARADAAQAEAAIARAQQSDAEALVARQKLEIEKLKREIYGPRSERARRLVDQLELELEELEATATEDELRAEQDVAKATTVAAFSRKRPARKPFPEHLPRERVIVPGPAACTCYGGARLSKLGEDITETLEVIPRRWKVIQHVREKFSCRDCETISQAPAPFHIVRLGWAGPNLLAMIAFEKSRRGRVWTNAAHAAERASILWQAEVPHYQVYGGGGAIFPVPQDHLLKIDRRPIRSAIAAFHISTMDLPLDLGRSEHRCSHVHITVGVGHKPQVTDRHGHHI
jgi:transposase